MTIAAAAQNPSADVPAPAGEDERVPTFAELGLPPALVSALSRQGIDAPFPIQAAAIPDIMAGNDVLGRGKTGSGKTLAFGLPMLARLAGRKNGGPLSPDARRDFPSPQ